MSGCFSSRSQYRFLSLLLNLQGFFRRAPLSAGIAYDHISSPDGQINVHSLGATLEISRGFSVGPVSGEVHMSESNTQTIACVNVYDLYYSLSDRVIEWASG